MNISFLKEKGTKYIIFVLLGLLALVLMIPSTGGESKSKAATYTDNTTINQQLENVLASMEGVGEVKVMITTSEQKNSLFASEEEKNQVSGVVVVAQGAGDATVESRIFNAVKALFGIDAHKISIVKMKSKEEDG